MGFPATPSQLTSATSIQIAGVKCWDCFDESVGEKYTRTNGSSADRLIICGWNDSATLINALFPPTGAVQSGGYVAFPFAYPRNTLMLLMDAELKLLPSDDPTLGPLGFGIYNDLFGNTQSLLAPGAAWIRLRYSTQPYVVSDAGELEADMSVERYNLPYSTPIFSFTSNTTSLANALPAEDNPPLEVPVISINYTRRYQTQIPWANIISALTSPVNSVAFKLTNAGTNTSETMAVGTVKYEGARSNFSPIGGTPGGQWKVIHRFKFRPSPFLWNNALNPNASPPAFAPIYYLNSSNSIYATSDLNVLIS